MSQSRSLLLTLSVRLGMAGGVMAFDPMFDTRIDYDAGSAPHSVFSVDLDGDSDCDLAVGNRYSNNISILLNNGDGTFAAVVSYAAGVSNSRAFLRSPVYLHENIKQLEVI